MISNKYTSDQKVWFSVDDNIYAGIIKEIFYDVKVRTMDKRIKRCNFNDSPASDKWILRNSIMNVSLSNPKHVGSFIRKIRR